MQRVLVLIMICFALPATAQQTFKCDLIPNSRYGWIPREFIVEISENEKQATEARQQIH